MQAIQYHDLEIEKDGSNRYFIRLKPGQGGNFLTKNSKPGTPTSESLDDYYFSSLKAAKQAVLRYKFPNIGHFEGNNCHKAAWYIYVGNMKYLHNDGIARDGTNQRKDNQTVWSGFFHSRSNAIRCYLKYLASLDKAEKA